MSAVRPTNLAPATPLPTGASVTASYSGDDADWTTSGEGTVIALDYLVDVDVPAPTDGDVLTWDDYLGAWVASPAAGTPDAELNIEGGQSVIKPHGAMGAAETFDPTDGNVHTGTLDADCTFTLNAPTGTGACTLELRLTQDGTGGWAVTWPGSVTLVGTLDTTASTTSIVIVETLDDGTSWVAVVVGGAAGVTYGTPAIVLGTAAAAGATDEAIRRDATIVAFDATVPVTQAYGDAAATGAAAVAARRDHRHGMPAASGTSASDANIWRPLMDGAGAVITDGTGQAVMAYGPA